MEDSKVFYGFRGSIEFSDQLSLFSLGIENNTENKSNIFKTFFSKLEELKMVHSDYKKRDYLLIFCNKYEDIIHCQLARKKEYLKHELVDSTLVEKIDDDYPNVNIFVQLDSQKFLIESNSQIFENYNTCRDVIENIMNGNFDFDDVYIVLEDIVKEERFWDSFNKNIPVYSIEFLLNSPNLFNSSSDAEDFMKASYENTQANQVSLKFINKEGNIKPHPKGIDSYVKYASAGGGSWSQIVQGENGKKIKITSKQKSQKIIININHEQMKDNNIEKSIDEIKNKFSMIETIERFK